MVIPGVNVGIVSADQVNSHLVQDTIEAANKINRDFITVVEANAVEAAEDGYSLSDVYDAMLKLAAEYKTVNKTEYMEPTAAFVSPRVYAKLLKNNLIYFKDNRPISVFGFEVIECPDLSKDIVMLNQVAMASGIAWKDVTVFDAAPLGYAGGTAYIGEMAYVNAAVDLGPVAYNASTNTTGVKPILFVAFSD